MTNKIARLEALEGKDIGEDTYYPIGNTRDLNRAYEEARLFRRLGYKARVMEYHYPNDPIDEKHFIVMVARSRLYGSSGGWPKND